jgi:hypothetical protein
MNRMPNSTTTAQRGLDLTSIVISMGGTTLIVMSLWVLYLVVAGRIPDLVICL